LREVLTVDEILVVVVGTTVDDGYRGIGLEFEEELAVALVLVVGTLVDERVLDKLDLEEVLAVHD
jgi:hypothetical protein